MPIYEYQCTACNERREYLQKFNDDPVTECPICGGTMKRLISNSSFILKGTGWYITDYARKNSGNGGNGSSSSSEKKSDSKAETKA